MAHSKRKRQADGLQFDLDQEMADRECIFDNSPKVIKNQCDLEPSGWGDFLNSLYNILYGIYIPSSPPTPPSPQNPANRIYEDPELSKKRGNSVSEGGKPCLYEDPATRETIRRKLKEFGITNANQLIRTYTAAVLLEAISDFERALDAGVRFKSRTGYFRYLLK